MTENRYSYLVSYQRTLSEYSDIELEAELNRRQQVAKIRRIEELRAEAARLQAEVESGK